MNVRSPSVSLVVVAVGMNEDRGKIAVETLNEKQQQRDQSPLHSGFMQAQERQWRQYIERREIYKLVNDLERPLFRIYILPGQRQDEHGNRIVPALSLSHLISYHESASASPTPTPIYNHDAFLVYLLTSSVIRLQIL